MTLELQQNELQTLDRMPKGSAGLVITVDSNHSSSGDLRRLGFNEGAEVEILQSSNLCLVRCDNACIALHRDILQAVCVHCPGGVECCLTKPAVTKN